MIDSTRTSVKFGRIEDDGRGGSSLRAIADEIWSSVKLRAFVTRLQAVFDTHLLLAKVIVKQDRRRCSTTT
jgi:hypothetical protein